MRSFAARPKWEYSWSSGQPYKCMHVFIKNRLIFLCTSLSLSLSALLFLLYSHVDSSTALM